MPMFRLTLAACALALATPALTAKPVDQVRVGFSTSISGPFAALGAEARDGFNLGIKQLGGKLGGIPVEVFATDEAGNPDTGRQHVDRYIKRDRVHFFTGPIGSNVALAVGPTLFAAQVFYLSNNAGPSQLAGSQCNRVLLRHRVPERRVPRGRGQVRRRARIQAGRGARPQLPGRTGRDQRLQARLRQGR